MTARTALLLLLAGFALCGLLHVVLYGVDYAFHFVQFFCGTVLLVWCAAIRNRVTDSRLRSLLLAMAAALIGMLTLQTIRYGLYGTNYVFRHWAWYADYLCTAVLGIAVYCLALCIHRPEHRALSAAELLPCAMLILLTLGVFTNDLHHLALRFPPGSLQVGQGDEIQGPLYFAFYGVFAVMLFSAMVVMVRKWRRSPSRLARMLPLVPLLLLAFFLTMNLLDFMPHVAGVRIWNNAEIFIFCSLGFVEAFISIGLIPANQGYAALFGQSGVEAAILDEAGEPVYLSGTIGYPFAADEDVEVRMSSIRGGKVAWTVDVGPIRRLNAQLKEVVGQLEARNAYLEQENRIKREQAALDARVRIYDDISAMVSPQIAAIAALVGQSGSGDVMPAKEPMGAEGTVRLAKAAVLGVYIKRRSNMELLAGDGMLPADELAAALAETVEYLKLLGVDALVSSAGSGMCSSNAVTAAFEGVEACIEENLDGLSVFLAVLRAHESGFSLRLMFRADPLRIPEGLAQMDSSASLRVETATAGDGTSSEAIITFFCGGGGRP